MLENSVNPREGPESNISHLFFSHSTYSVECSLGMKLQLIQFRKQVVAHEMLAGLITWLWTSTVHDA